MHDPNLIIGAYSWEEQRWTVKDQKGQVKSRKYKEPDSHYALSNFPRPTTFFESSLFTFN